MFDCCFMADQPFLLIQCQTMFIYIYIYIYIYIVNEYFVGNFIFKRVFRTDLFAHDYICMQTNKQTNTHTYMCVYVCASDIPIYLRFNMKDKKIFLICVIAFQVSVSINKILHSFYLRDFATFSSLLATIQKAVISFLRTGFLLKQLICANKE